MRNFFILLCIFFIPSLLSAASYTRLDGATVDITRPTGLPSQVDMLLDEKIDLFLPDDATSSLDPTMSGTLMDPHNWEYTIDIRKVYEDSTTLSLLMTTYQYTGGAHGSSARRGIVIDKSTWTQLSIGDLYQERPLVYRLGPLWRQQILSRINEMNGEITPEDRTWVREGTVDGFHYNSFTLSEKFITIYGQEYQHVPYAYGVQTLRYPLYRLADIAK